MLESCLKMCVAGNKTLTTVTQEQNTELNLESKWPHAFFMRLNKVPAVLLSLLNDARRDKWQKCFPRAKEGKYPSLTGSLLTKHLWLFSSLDKHSMVSEASSALHQQSQQGSLHWQPTGTTSWELKYSRSFRHVSINTKLFQKLSYISHVDVMTPKHLKTKYLPGWCLIQLWKIKHHHGFRQAVTVH